MAAVAADVGAIVSANNSATEAHKTAAAVALRARSGTVPCVHAWRCVNARAVTDDSGLLIEAPLLAQAESVHRQLRTQLPLAYAERMAVVAEDGPGLEQVVRAEAHERDAHPAVAPLALTPFDYVFA